MRQAKECFVISPIGEQGSTTRWIADTVLDKIIKPALVDLGYEPVRADHLGMPGDINDQVIKHLRNAPLAVAVLHENNPNVYYEMAVRHTLAQPVIPLAPAKARLPFDVRRLRTVFVDTQNAKSIENAKREIARQAKAFEIDPTLGPNPVTGT